MCNQSPILKHRVSFLIAFACVIVVPFIGTSLHVLAEGGSQPEEAVSNAGQIANHSSDRDELTIAQQFTAGLASDNTTSPVGTAEVLSKSNTNDNTSDDEPPKLVDLVADYLKADLLSDRTKQGQLIVKSSGADIAKVARALEAAQVWDNSPPPKGDFITIMVPGGDVRVFYELPAACDSTRAYPLLVQMPSEAGVVDGIQDSNWAQIIKDVIVITPSRQIGGQFHRTAETAGSFHTLLNSIRKRFHVDPSSVYLEGMATGGNGAWCALTAYHDELSAAAIRYGFLDVPYRKQLYALLLSNLGNLQVYNLWISPELDGSKEIQKVVDVCNQAVRNLARRYSLPIKSQIAASFKNDAVIMVDQYRELSKVKREPIPPKLSHWFRYPEQGQCAWLRQTKFAGDVWTAEQLSILPGPDVDADQYITDVLKSLLAYMGGEIEGNTIRIETRRCADIELLLYENMVDFTKPVVVYINGKKRHDRIVKPSIPTLLEEAYDTFDFQRLVFAKLAFEIKEDSTASTGK